MAEFAPMKAQTDTENRRRSHIEDALSHLDECIERADKVGHVLIERLSLVLQPEAPLEAMQTDGALVDASPHSSLVGRLDDAALSIESLRDRLSRAIDRLET